MSVLTDNAWVQAADVRRPAAGRRCWLLGRSTQCPGAPPHLPRALTATLPHECAADSACRVCAGSEGSLQQLHGRSTANACHLTPLQCVFLHGAGRRPGCAVPCPVCLHFQRHRRQPGVTPVLLVFLMLSFVQSCVRVLDANSHCTFSTMSPAEKAVTHLQLLLFATDG